ncbi:hypothetical protein ACFXAF_25020, partial [Kitasatospora sp. NPDC059463]
MGMFMLERDHREGNEAQDVLARARTLVDPVLRAAVDSLPGTMRRVAGYHFGWWEADGSPSTASSGKAIRPALVLAAAQALGGDPAPAPAPAAPAPPSAARLPRPGAGNRPFAG